MNESYSFVVKIIKDYVYTCGGDVTVPELIDDYHTSFSCDIPFKKFGYSNLIDFLISITGLSVIIHDGEYHIHAKWSKSSSSSQSSRSKLSSDMSLLCVEMQNNLSVSDTDAKRKVTVKANRPFTYSEKPVPKLHHNYYFQPEEYDSTFSLANEQYSSTNYDLNSSCSSKNDYSVNYSELNEFTPDKNVYFSPTNDNLSYESNLQHNASSFYDSPFMYQTQASAADSDFKTHRKYLFAEHIPPVEYNGLYSSFDRRENANFNLDQPLPVSEKQMINRLVALVNAHKKKITSSAVEVSYIDSYSDTLPKNWLSLLEESNQLYIEQLTTGTMIYPSRTISEIPTMSDLPNIGCPHHMPWSVDITIINSTDSIWFRLNENDLNRRYQILNREMQKHYQDMLPGKVIFAGIHQLFVAKVKNKPVRVCVLRQENDVYKCLAIDEGTIEILSSSSFMTLHEKFTNTPKLILQGSLVGLNKYAECSHIRNKLQKMVVNVDTSVVVEKCEAGKLAINLFVTSKSYDSVNVNEYLLDVVKQELNLPKFEINGVYDVKIVSLSVKDNLAKVQVKSPCYEVLQESLRKCNHIIDCTDERLLFAKNITDVQLNQLYLARYTDGSWQRVLLKQFVNSTHVVVVFVDFQDIQALEVNKIICYANFPDALTYIPPQGVTVSIVKTDYQVLKLMNMKLKTNLFSMKVVQTNPKLYVQMYLNIPQSSSGDSGNVKQVYCSDV